MQAIERQPGLFDYDALTPTTRDIVQRRTGEIQDLMRRTAADIVDIGLKLIEVKGILGHGNFGVWLGSEFGWSEPTAQRFMRVSEAFKTVNLTVLDIAPSALYALASGETPEIIRQEFIERAQAGEKVTNKAVTQRLTAHKEQFQPLPNVRLIPTDPRPEPVQEAFDHEQQAIQELRYPQTAAPRVIDMETGEVLEAPTMPHPDEDYDSPAVQALIKPDPNHVIDMTPSAFEQQLMDAGWDDANKFENVARRAIDALTALNTYTRQDLHRIAESAGGQQLMTNVRITRVQQLCATFLQVSDAPQKVVTL